MEHTKRWNFSGETTHEASIRQECLLPKQLELQSGDPRFHEPHALRRETFGSHVLMKDQPNLGRPGATPRRLAPPAGARCGPPSASASLLPRSAARLRCAAVQDPLLPPRASRENDKRRRRPSSCFVLFSAGGAPPPRREPSPRPGRRSGRRPLLRRARPRPEEALRRPLPRDVRDVRPVEDAVHRRELPVVELRQQLGRDEEALRRVGRRGRADHLLEHQALVLLVHPLQRSAAAQRCGGGGGPGRGAGGVRGVISQTQTPSPPFAAGELR